MNDRYVVQYSIEANERAGTARFPDLSAAREFALSVTSGGRINEAKATIRMIGDEADYLAAYRNVHGRIECDDRT